MGNHLHSIEILLVEDNEADILLTQEAFAKANLNGPMHVARDGVEAMAFLRHEGNYASSQRPDLILLDLNMPRMSGREVLSEMKNDPVLRNIPVAVLTTSSAENDVSEAYKLHANCYIVKPSHFDSFVQAVHSLYRFWFEIVTLPT